jgi:2-oxoisovalerate dehydrogenase E1 component alpha subunit
VFAQYREQGVLLWRGFTPRDCADQCYSNALEQGKGRQMPIHYGSTKLHFQTISSPLATQLPHAVGAAYAMKVGNSWRRGRGHACVWACVQGRGGVRVVRG